MSIPIEAVTTSALSAALDAAARRHAAIATNIANANAPGHAPVRLAFDDHLAEAQAAWRSGATLEPAQVDAIRGNGLILEEGTEAVQIDVEMAELARNSAQFQALAQALSRHLGMLALAAADGRR